jgi:hypothetical protein
MFLFTEYLCKRVITFFSADSEKKNNCFGQLFVSSMQIPLAPYRGQETAFFDQKNQKIAKAKEQERERERGERERERREGKRERGYSERERVNLLS